jgi:hypothetical protein
MIFSARCLGFESIYPLCYISCWAFVKSGNNSYYRDRNCNICSTIVTRIPLLEKNDGDKRWRLHAVNCNPFYSRPIEFSIFRGSPFPRPLKGPLLSLSIRKSYTIWELICYHIT